MIEYSHRDRRAHRDVGRAVGMMIGVILVLIGIALVVRLPFVGIAAVVALGVVGAVYLVWSEGMLASYSDDLRLALEGRETDGFTRVEVTTTVGLERDVGRPTALSPHSRRRYAARTGDDDSRKRGDGPRTGQP